MAPMTSTLRKRSAVPATLLSLVGLLSTARAARPMSTQTKLKRKVLSSSLVNVTELSPTLDAGSKDLPAMTLKLDCGNICTKDDDLFFSAGWTGILMARTEEEAQMQKDRTSRLVPKWKGRLTCGQYSRILQNRQEEERVCLYDKTDDTKPELAILQQTHPHIEDNCCMDMAKFDSEVRAVQMAINSWECSTPELCKISPWELRELVTEIMVQVKDLKMGAVDLNPQDVVRTEEALEALKQETTTREPKDETPLTTKQQAASIIRKYFQDEQLKALVTHLYQAIDWVMARKKHKLGEVVEVFNKVEEVLEDPDHFMHQHAELHQLAIDAEKHQKVERDQMHWLLRNYEARGRDTDKEVYTMKERLEDALWQPVQDGRLKAEQRDALVKAVWENTRNTNRDPQDILFDLLEHNPKFKAMMGASLDTEILQTVRDSMTAPPLDGILKAVLGDHVQALGEANAECNLERELTCEDCRGRCDSVSNSLTQAYRALSSVFYDEEDRKTPAMDKYIHTLEKELKAFEDKHREIMITARLYKMSGLP